jgi:hypothetical protein
MRAPSTPWLVGGALVALSLAGCSGEGAQAPNPTRPLDERRAIEVIRRAIGQAGEKPGPARELALSSGKPIRIDVGVDGHEYGIVYVTEADAAELGAAIPKPTGGDKLQIARGGPDGSTRVVLLFAGSYLYDDHVGEAHEQTIITSEGKLARDVRDFITHARTNKLP